MRDRGRDEGLWVAGDKHVESNYRSDCTHGRVSGPSSLLD